MKSLSRTKIFNMKNTKRLLSSFVAILTMVCISYTTMLAQNYVTKTEAIEILETELKSVSGELPGLQHNSTDYIKVTEKIRVFKGILRHLNAGESLSQALHKNVPTDDNRTIQPFVRAVQDSSGKTDPKWIVAVINDLLTV